MNATVQKIGSTALLALFLLGPAASGGPGGHVERPDEPGQLSVTAQRREFSIRGRSLRLYPGVRRRMRVTVVNRTRTRITVRRIRATVGEANARCGPATLRVGRFRGSVRIPPGGRRRVRLPVRMRADAPDACQGARYPITFTGWRRTP